MLPRAKRKGAELLLQALVFYLSFCKSQSRNWLFTRPSMSAPETKADGT